MKPISDKNKIVNEKKQTKLKWKLLKPWLAVAGLGGAGFLPCPDCGAPLGFHLWPIALVLALFNLRKSKRRNQIEEICVVVHENEQEIIINKIQGENT